MPSDATRNLFKRFLLFSANPPQVTKEHIVDVAPDSFCAYDSDGDFCFDLAIDPHRPDAHRSFQPAFAGFSPEEAKHEADNLLLACVENVWSRKVAKICAGLPGPQRACYLHSLAWRSRGGGDISPINDAAQNHPYLLAAAAFASHHNKADFFDFVFHAGQAEAAERLETAFQFFATQSDRDPMVAPKAVGIGSAHGINLRVAAVADAAEAVFERKVDVTAALWMMRAMVEYDKRSASDAGAKVLSAYFGAVNQGADMPEPIPLFQTRILDDPASLKAITNSILSGNADELAILIGTYKNSAVRSFVGGGEIPQIPGVESFSEGGWKWRAVHSPKELLGIIAKINCLAMMPPPPNSTIFYGTGANDKEAICAIDLKGDIHPWLPMCKPAPPSLVEEFKTGFQHALSKASDDPTPDPTKPAANRLLGFPARGATIPFLAHESVKTMRTSMAALLSQRVGGLSSELISCCEAMADRFQVVCMHDPKNGQNVGYAIIESGRCGATKDAPAVEARLLTAHMDYLPDGSEPQRYLLALEQYYSKDARAFSQRPGVEMGIEALMIFASGTLSKKELDYANQQLLGAISQKGDFAGVPDLYDGLEEFQRDDAPMLSGKACAGLRPPSMAKTH